MLKKIYQELVLIRKELQAIRICMEFKKAQIKANEKTSSNAVTADINIVTHRIAELLQEQIAKNHG